MLTGSVVVMRAGEKRDDPAMWFVALDGDAEWLEEMGSRFLGAEGLRFAGGTLQERDVQRLVMENAAEVVLVGDYLGRDALGIASALAKAMPTVRVFVMARDPTAEMALRARQCGIRGVLRKPFRPEDLEEAIRADLEAEQRQLERIGGLAPSSGSAVVDGPRAVEGVAPRVIAVFSFKGGVGKTLIAVNLALAARSGPNRRWSTALVDADDGLGTSHVLLGVPSQPALTAWEDYAGERMVDPAVVERKLVAALRCGLHAVFSSGCADVAAREEVMETVLGTLRSMHALVVVDCAPEVTEAVFTALRLADIVALVVDPMLGSTEKVRLGLRALVAGGMQLQKFRLVVNQNRPGAGGFRPAEVREALQLQVLGSIPFDPTARMAENRREPLAMSSPRGPFMRALVRTFDPLLPGLMGSARGRG